MKDQPEQNVNGLFLIGILLLAFSIFVIFESWRMPWEKSSYLISPGFVPMLTGVCLLVASILLTTTACKQGGGRNWKTWLSNQCSDEENKRFLMILSLVAFLVVGLVGRVPFVLAMFIFHVLIFSYLRVGSFWKIAISSIGATILVAILMPKTFDMPLP